MRSERIKLNLALYKKLYLVCQCEKAIVENYKYNDMKTPMHMSVGQEAIAVGVCHALGAKGQIFTSYRSHAAYLAKSENSDGFFAELYGKETSLAKGKAGSMHLSDPERGVMVASAIVAGLIPVAMGAAFAKKRQNDNSFVAIFFGDGAIDEGGFWESINFSSLKKLPILFVCEDNNYSVCTPKSERHGYVSITDVISKFDCNVFSEDTNDVEVIYQLTCNAIELSKKNERPSFLHLKYQRFLEHVGIKEDFDQGFRSREEFNKWLEEKGDRLTLQRDKLLQFVQETEIMKIEREVEKQVAWSVELAKKASFSPCDEVYKGVYA